MPPAMAHSIYYEQYLTDILFHKLRMTLEQYSANDIEVRVISVPLSFTVEYDNYVSIHYDPPGASLHRPLADTSPARFRGR